MPLDNLARIGRGFNQLIDMLGGSQAARQTVLRGAKGVKGAAQGGRRVNLGALREAVGETNQLSLPPTRGAGGKFMPRIGRAAPGQEDLFRQTTRAGELVPTGIKQAPGQLNIFYQPTRALSRVESVEALDPGVASSMRALAQRAVDIGAAGNVDEAMGVFMRGGSAQTDLMNRMDSLSRAADRTEDALDALRNVDTTPRTAPTIPTPSRNRMSSVQTDLNGGGLAGRLLGGAAIGVPAGSVVGDTLRQSNNDAGVTSPTSGDVRDDQLPTTGNGYTPNTELAGDLPVTREQQMAKLMRGAEDAGREMGAGLSAMMGGRPEDRTIITQNEGQAERDAAARSLYDSDNAAVAPRSPEFYGSAAEYFTARNRYDTPSERENMKMANGQARDLLMKQAANSAIADQFLSENPYEAFEIRQRLLQDDNANQQTQQNIATETYGSQLGDNTANNAVGNSEAAAAATMDPNQGNTDLENASMGFKKPVLLTKDQADRYGRKGASLDSTIQDFLLEKAFERRNDPTSPFVGTSTQLRY